MPAITCRLSSPAAVSLPETYTTEQMSLTNRLKRCRVGPTQESKYDWLGKGPWRQGCVDGSNQEGTPLVSEPSQSDPFVVALPKKAGSADACACVEIPASTVRLPLPSAR